MLNRISRMSVLTGLAGYGTAHDVEATETTRLVPPTGAVIAI
jgi:hypothetical protein